MPAGLLPLFPLPVVLIPRTPMPLHIFEDRYNIMVGEAIDANSEFGIVLSGEKGIVNIGCTAVVDKVVERYADGRLDIIAVGRRRFELLELDHERQFLRGAVEFYDDEDEEEVPADIRQQVISSYEQIMKLTNTSPLLDPELSDKQFSFQIAHVVTDVNVRQLLLMSRSEADRIRQLAEHFPALLKERLQVAKAQHSASTNGHGTRPAGL
jgi:Lon protease-like protein